MDKILLGYYSSYKVKEYGMLPRIELYNLRDKEDANYGVFVIGNVLYITQNDGTDDFFPERVFSSFEVEFMGDL